MVTDILAERSAEQLEADAFAQTHVDDGELLLPSLQWKLRKLVHDGEFGVGVAFLKYGLDLVSAFGEPVRVIGEVDEEPSSVYATIEKTSE